MDGGETLVPDKMRLVKPWKTEPRSKSPFTTKDNSFARKDLKDDDGVVTHELHQGILKSLQPKLVAWSRMRVWRGVLQPKDGKEIPFLILISFLATFAGSRLFNTLFPDTLIVVRGTHVHHFAYGFILLALIGYYAITQPREPKTRLKLSLLYGFALGVAFDEFAMWIQLDDIYKDRSTYDAIVIITLILLNIVYFDDFWRKWGHRLRSLFHRLFT